LNVGKIEITKINL